MMSITTRKQKSKSFFLNLPKDSPEDEVYLWRAVLDQAYSDYKNIDRMPVHERNELLVWVDEFNADFQECCQLAKLNPEWVFAYFNGKRGA